MSGLNIITDAILDKARAEADLILKDADEKKAEIMAEANAKIAEIKQEIASDTQIKQSNIKAAAKAASFQQLARDLLKRKTVFLEGVANEVKERVYTLADDEYNKIILNLLSKYANPSKKGEIAFCEKDKNRISDEVKLKINALNLEISAENAKIKGGFILKYGRVEENASIEAIFHDRQEEITDFLNKELFS